VEEENNEEEENTKVRQHREIENEEGSKQFNEFEKKGSEDIDVNNEENEKQEVNEEERKEIEDELLADKYVKQVYEKPNVLRSTENIEKVPIKKDTLLKQFEREENVNKEVLKEVQNQPVKNENVLSNEEKIKRRVCCFII